MYDSSLVIDILRQIDIAIEKIEYRFASVQTASDFTASPRGMEKLDAICMQLIAIGESVKNIDKVAGKQFLARYGQVDWKGVKGLRDIITHHYFDVDAEAIYAVCSQHIPQLKATIRELLANTREKHNKTT